MGPRRCHELRAIRCVRPVVRSEVSCYRHTVETCLERLERPVVYALGSLEGKDVAAILGHDDLCGHASWRSGGTERRRLKKCHLRSLRCRRVELKLAPIGANPRVPTENPRRCRIVSVSKHGRGHVRDFEPAVGDKIPGYAATD